MIRASATAAVCAAAAALGLAGMAAAQDEDAATGKVLDLRAKVLDLERKVTSQGGAVARIDKGREVRVGLSADVLFAFDSARLTRRSRKALAEAASTVDREAGGVVRVEGHTDSKGSHGYNQRLSERRARSVERALSRLVDARVSFRVRGIGEREPVAPNTKKDGSDNPAGRRLNRRVEVRFGRK
jgi:outer membrane protein OmpA-like peptidoglycan-associated protein